MGNGWCLPCILESGNSLCWGWGFWGPKWHGGGSGSEKWQVDAGRDDRIVGIENLRRKDENTGAHFFVDHSNQQIYFTFMQTTKMGKTENLFLWIFSYELFFF